MASNVPDVNQDKIDILTEFFRSKKIIAEPETFNLENKDKYIEKITKLKEEMELKPEFRTNPDYRLYNDINRFLKRKNEFNIVDIYSYLEIYLNDIITAKQNAQIVKLPPAETRSDVKVDMIKPFTESINYDKAFVIMSECVEEAHRAEINTYKTDLEKAAPEKLPNVSDFIEMVRTFVLEATNVLIIDNENYIYSKLEQDKILKDCVETRGITHIIVVYKSHPYNYSKVIGNSKIKILEIESAGLTLNKIKTEFTREAQTTVRPIRYGGNSRGFGASPSVSAHLNNAHDDFMILVIYEICKDFKKVPLIFIQDEQIKVDLLTQSNAIKGVYNYKHILPFLCHVNGIRFYIKPEIITLTGNEWKFDNYYLKFGSREQDHYLQKYLKYKSKYMQLKKLI